MKPEDEKVEVIFKKEFDARNKLVRFIINKILEDYNGLEGTIDGYGVINGERANIRHNK